MVLTDDVCSLKALRLVANLVKPVGKFHYNVLEDYEVLLKASDIAFNNKIFLPFYEGLTKIKREAPDRICEITSRQLRKKKLFDEALTKIAEAAERRDLEFMVFKTLKPFTYVGDDIDFFLPTSNFKSFIELLKEQGYHLMGYGPPEATFVKEVSDMHVMMDVHRAFSASYVPYLDGMRVWGRRVEREFNGYKVHVPSLKDEMLILVGHSVMKEFRINLADFYHAIFLLDEVDWNELCSSAHVESMYYALVIFINTVKYIYELLYLQQPSNVTISNNGYLLGVADKVLWVDLSRGTLMPYFYHLYLPAIAYLDKLRCNVFHERGGDLLTFLFNMLKAPFTNKEGISILLNYLSRSV